MWSPGRAGSLDRQGTQGVTPAGQSRASRTGSVGRKGTQGRQGQARPRDATPLPQPARQGRQGKQRWIGFAWLQ